MCVCVCVCVCVCGLLKQQTILCLTAATGLNGLNIIMMLLRVLLLLLCGEYLIVCIMVCLFIFLIQHKWVLLLKTEYFSSAFPPSTAKGRLRQFYRGLEQVNRTDAVKECRTKYTDLVTVYDQHDNIELSKLLNGNSSGWIGAHIGNCSKKWSNGDEVTYKKDFNMCCGGTCCAAMKADGDLESLQCEQKRQFMCYEQGNTILSYNYIILQLIQPKQYHFLAFIQMLGEHHTTTR